MKRCEKTYTETEREKNLISVGWYSKDDLKQQLKWNASLGSSISSLGHFVITPGNLTTQIFQHVAPFFRAKEEDRRRNPSLYAGRRELGEAGQFEYVMAISMAFYSNKTDISNASSLVIFDQEIFPPSRTGHASTEVSQSTG